MTLDISLIENLLQSHSHVEVQPVLLKNAKLPIHTPESMSFEDFMKHMMRDKKVLSGQLRLVLPTSIGTAEVVADVPQDIIKQAIDFCRTL